MSRTLVIRRLTAVIVLLAILGFALPATAAPEAHHSSRATTVQTPSFFDQILSWLGISGFGTAGSDAHARTDLRKATSLTPPLWEPTGQTVSSADASQGMDPNGFH
jgi:hypothetical protein